MGRIAICMIVKNEEQQLGRCLRSVEGLGDIYISDTGSDDKTVEIAKRYTPHVFEDYKWNDNFSEARNWILDKCDAEWILSIDADEHMAEGDLEKVLPAIEKAEKEGFKSVSTVMGGAHCGETYYFPRIFKNDGSIRWQGAIHNHLNVADNNKSDIKIVYSYSAAHKNDPDRALRILQSETKDPKKIRELYYLAREWWYRKDYRKAIRVYERYLRVAYWYAEKADAYLMKARCHAAVNEYTNARESCMQAININADFKEALDFMSRLVGPNNAARWQQAAFRATNKNVLFVRDIRNYRDRQLIACIPDLFNYKTVLYVGANIYRCDVLKDFRNHDYIIDIVEPFQRNIDHYKDVVGINNIHKRTIQDFKATGKVDVVFWWHGPEHVNKDELKLSIDNMERVASKYVVMGCPWGQNEQKAIYGNDYEQHRSSMYAEDFEKYGYTVNTVGTKDTWVSNLIAWKQIRS